MCILTRTNGNGPKVSFLCSLNSDDGEFVFDGADLILSDLSDLSDLIRKCSRGDATFRPEILFSPRYSRSFRWLEFSPGTLCRRRRRRSTACILFWIIFQQQFYARKVGNGYVLKTYLPLLFSKVHKGAVCALSVQNEGLLSNTFQVGMIYSRVKWIITYLLRHTYCVLRACVLTNVFDRDLNYDVGKPILRTLHLPQDHWVNVTETGWRHWVATSLLLPESAGQGPVLLN